MSPQRQEDKIINKNILKIFRHTDVAWGRHRQTLRPRASLVGIDFGDNGRGMIQEWTTQLLTLKDGHLKSFEGQADTIRKALSRDSAYRGVWKVKQYQNLLIKSLHEIMEMLASHKTTEVLESKVVAYRLLLNELGEIQVEIEDEQHRLVGSFFLNHLIEEHLECTSKMDELEDEDSKSDLESLVSGG
jgi:hypothetical protein